MSRPAHILSVATAVPPHAVSTAQVKDVFPKAFRLDARRLATIHAVIDHARIRTRYFVNPLDKVITPRPLDQTACEFKQHSIELGQNVAEQALAQAQLSPRDIDLMITVSCTGVMIPSLDAHLANLMGFRPDVKRLPITELGCAAGAAALGRAADYVRAFPDSNVLIVVIELPSLTLQTHDNSPDNLISCCLFGDGAAACVLTGRPAPGLSVLEARSHILPNTLDSMGFDLRSTGLHVFLSKNVPQLIRDEIQNIVGLLLDQHGLQRQDLAFFLLHPGGQKLLSNIEEQLGLTETDTATAWDVLSDYGNLSAATILFVVKEFLARPKPRSGARGFLAAFGPGFSTEMALMQWE